MSISGGDVCMVFLFYFLKIYFQLKMDIEEITRRKGKEI